METIFGKMQEKYIECYASVKLHTIIFGSGEPVILLHGFPDFWYGWKHVILGLKDEFKLIVPDTRGINLSDKPEDVKNYSIDILVEDIKILSEKLNLGKFTLVGHDWGGTIAWNFSYKYPDLLKKLVIINSPHPEVFRKKLQNNPEQRRASRYIFEFLKPGAAENLLKNDMMRLKAAVFETAQNRNAFTEEDKQNYIESWSQPNSILCGVNYYRAYMNIETSIGIIEVPTLVIHGMKDDFVRPVVLEGLQEYVKDLKIVHAEHSSHWIMHDAPEFICLKIKEFVRS
ncbi:MAG: alpha/beta fold hydrolase [Promethearchaeota archaeon]